VRDQLARARVPLGFLCGVLVFGLASPTGVSLTYGAAIAIAGEALRIWAAGHLNKSREVTTSGPYRLFAHPLYVGSAILATGLAVASNRLSAGIVIMLYVAVTLTAAIRSEETFLRGKFGDTYAQYRRGAGTDNVKTRFNLARAIANHEHRTIGGVVLAWLLLALKATYNGVFWRTAGT
jgi:hypothetical protein